MHKFISALDDKTKLKRNEALHEDKQIVLEFNKNLFKHKLPLRISRKQLQQHISH